MDTFYSEILAFYITAVKEVKMLPFNDEVLKNLKCLNTLLQGQTTLRTIFRKLSMLSPTIISQEEKMNWNRSVVHMMCLSYQNM